MEHQSGPRVFAVLTDTLSTLANFAPSKEEDPSVRGIEADVKKLFHPFIQVLKMKSISTYCLGFVSV